MDLIKIAPLIVENIQKALKEKEYPFGRKGIKGNKFASGNLSNSVKATMKNTSEGPAIMITMDFYSQYVQKGRPGGGFKSSRGRKRGPRGSNKQDGPFIEALKKWIKSRKLKGRDKKGRYITDRSFAYAIRTNIFKFGIRPANFINVAIDNILEDDRIIELIGDEAMEDLLNAIQGI
jgi:hypothetical protein